MGWKYRKGRAYYYKSEREGGRVKSTYVGGGPDAEAVETSCQDAREKRAAAEVAWQAERRRLDDEESDARAMFERIEALTEAVLLAAGYRRHKRGAWRRTRR